MKKILSILAVGASTLIFSDVQAQRVCGNDLIMQEAQKDPFIKAYFDEYFKQYDAENHDMAEARKRSQSKTTAERYVIPVVFNFVLTQAEIDDLGGTNGIIERVNSQLQVLNEDFSASNDDIGDVPSSFKNDIGNAAIHFELAKINEFGKAQAGLNYKLKPASFTGYSPLDNQMKLPQGGIAPWDNTKYINVWVTNIQKNQNGGQVLGFAYNRQYAQAQYGNADFAGAVIHYLTLGRKTNPSQKFYSQNTFEGRTLTHELGHFFNIWHIWGKSTPAGSKSCTDDDGIDDTPLQEEANQSCPTGFQPNCPQKPNNGGEMYMNYMDYSSDKCTRMFSIGQVDRMRSELAPTGPLHSLTQNQHLAFWPADVSVVEYNNQVDVAPNPSTGFFNINLVEKYNNLERITVMNPVGQSVHMIPVSDQQKTNYKVNMTNFASGVYIIQLHFDEGIISRKVVLQR